MVNVKSSKIFQTGAFSVEYAYVLSILVLTIVGVSGVMKTPLANFMDCASEKIAEFIIGSSSVGCGSSRPELVDSIDEKKGFADSSNAGVGEPQQRLLTRRRADVQKNNTVASEGNSAAQPFSKSKNFSALRAKVNYQPINMECEQHMAEDDEIPSVGVSVNDEVVNCLMEENK